MEIPHIISSLVLFAEGEGGVGANILETIKKWNGVYPLYVGSGGSGTLLQLPAVTPDQTAQANPTPGPTQP